MGFSTIISGIALLIVTGCLIYLAWKNSDSKNIMSDFSGIDQVMLVTGESQFVSAVFCFAAAFIVLALYEQAAIPETIS